MITRWPPYVWDRHAGRSRSTAGVLKGGKGNDDMFGGAGFDDIRGNEGHDTGDGEVDLGTCDPTVEQQTDC